MGYYSLLRLFVVVSFIIGASSYIQPSLAVIVQREKAENIADTKWSFNIIMKNLADMMDHLHGNDLYMPDEPLSVEQSQPSFFPDASDEIAMKVFEHVYRNEQDIKNLRAIALTCTNGYRLMQDSYFWPALRCVYFGHLPKEYLDILILDKKEGGLTLCNTLFEQLSGYQKDEISRLKYLLTRQPSDSYPESCSFLINKISMNTKQEWLKKIENVENLDTLNSTFELYIHQEVLLNSINREIMREPCILEVHTDQRNINGILQNYSIAFVNLHCCLTRLPPDIDINFHGFHEVAIDLSDNHLRWVPDGLFISRVIRSLNLGNNLLRYLPEGIKDNREYLRSLWLDNFKRCINFPLVIFNEDLPTSGNNFYKFPSVILGLSNLKELGMMSVGLTEYPENLHEELPALSKLNVSHNNIPILPKCDFQDRQLVVQSCYNPGSSLNPFTLGDLASNIYPYSRRLSLEWARGDYYPLCTSLFSISLNVLLHCAFMTIYLQNMALSSQSYHLDYSQ